MLLADITTTFDASRTQWSRVLPRPSSEGGDSAPNVVAMLVVLVVGYIVARLVARLFTV